MNDDIKVLKETNFNIEVTEYNVNLFKKLRRLENLDEEPYNPGGSGEEDAKAPTMETKVYEVNEGEKGPQAYDVKKI